MIFRMRSWNYIRIGYGLIGIGAVPSEVFRPRSLLAITVLQGR